MRHAQKPIRTVAPASTPVSLSEAKAHLRVTSSAEDAVIQMYLDAAVSYLDGWAGVLGRCMVTQTWAQTFSDFPSTDTLALPFPEVQSVVVTYQDSAGDGQTLDASRYELVRLNTGSALVLADNEVWPDVDDTQSAVTITMVVGYGATSAVPAPLKQAILLHIGSMYEARTMAGELPLAHDLLIAPYRGVGL